MIEQVQVFQLVQEGFEPLALVPLCLLILQGIVIKTVDYLALHNS